MVGTFAITVATARVIGPRRLGYFNFVYWMVTIAGSLAAVGLPLTTLKYMSEYLGQGKQEIANAVFRQALKLQTLISIAISSIAVVAVLKLTLPEYRVISLFLALSIIPQMITFIPSQANVAAEDLRANTKGAAIGTVVNVTVVTLSLALGWDLLGIAIGVLLYRCAEMVAKLVPVLQKTQNGSVVPVPPELNRRMFRFSRQGAVLLLLQLVVWDRSDMIFLKLLQSDTRQLAFFSVPFSLVERLLLIPQPFVSALGASQMAESGRNKDKMVQFTGAASVYVLLLALPLLVGGALLSGPAIRLIYGLQYLPAVSVFAFAALFGIPKSVLGPAQNVLFSNEDLGFIIRWGVFAGVIDILLDLLLIPHHAALGAAIANGVGQAIAAAGIWTRAVKRFGVPINTRAVAKIFAATLLMAGAVTTSRILVSPVSVQLLTSAIVGATVYFLLIRALRVLSDTDRNRLAVLRHNVPKRLHGTFDVLANFIAGTCADEAAVM